LDFHDSYVLSVVAARANGARRLRRFRVAQSLWPRGIARAPAKCGWWCCLKAVAPKRRYGAPRRRKAAPLPRCWVG